MNFENAGEKEGKRRSLELLCRQLAVDYNVSSDAFFTDEVTVTQAADLPGRRHYVMGAPFFEMVTLGKGAVITADQKLHPVLRKWAEGRTGHWLFEHPNLMEVVPLLNACGYELFQTLHLYLPKEEIAPPPQPEGFQLEWLDREALKAFPARAAWPNALQGEENSGRPDVIALAAYDGNTLAALAGASADCGILWQIGVDTLPAYRGKGLGAAIVKTLAAKILESGRLPFYNTSLSNLHSQNIAINCGFFPAAVELAARKIEKKEGTA